MHTDVVAGRVRGRRKMTACLQPTTGLFDDVVSQEGVPIGLELEREICAA